MHSTTDRQTDSTLPRADHTDRLLNAEMLIISQCDGMPVIITSQQKRSNVRLQQA